MGWSLYLIDKEFIMLLIAQPKSASTSLATTIAQIANLKINLGVKRKADSKNCEGFSEIQKYHGNMVIRSELFFKQVIQGRKTLFKEHILPTDDHLEKLNKFKNDKIVILLRVPEDSYDAYKRLFESNKKIFNEEKLMNDLMVFHERYLYWKSVHKNVLLVYYRDLILRYKTTMRKILKHFGLNSPKDLPKLQKLKYTGVGEKRVCF